MSWKILIVEDEQKIAQILMEFLQAEGHDCITIGDGSVVLPYLEKHTVDFILLDVMLPGIDGLTLCQQIRQDYHTPIMMLTAKGEEVDRLMGLGFGADDYLCKPFSIREVAARIKTIMKRTHSQPSPPVSKQLPQFSGVTLNPNTFESFFGEHEIHLTPVEFRMLSYLLAHQDKVITRDALMLEAYPDHRIVSHRTIDSHIKNIRAKLSQYLPQVEDILISVYGVGYRLK